MKRSGRSISPERRAAVKGFLARVITERFGGNHTATAKALGLSQAQISDVVDDRSGPGLQLIEALADLERVSLDEVCGRRPSRKRRTPAEAEVPERGAAIDFARANHLTEEAIAKVLAAPAASLTAEDWYWRIKAATAEIAALDAKAPSTPPPATLERARKQAR